MTISVNKEKFVRDVLCAAVCPTAIIEFKSRKDCTK